MIELLVGFAILSVLVAFWFFASVVFGVVWYKWFPRSDYRPPPTPLDKVTVGVFIAAAILIVGMLSRLIGMDVMG